MCYVLCKLSLEHILLASGGLQALVYLDDALGNLAKFVGRKACKVFCFKRFAVVGTCCEGAQLLYVVVQSTCKSVEDDG